MKRTPMSRRIKPTTKEHAAATALARDSRCLLCGKVGCVPAHFGKDGRSGHRGMGGAKAGWDRSEWVPLCVPCHDLLDWRTGGVNEAARLKRDIARQLVLKRAVKWWGH